MRQFWALYWNELKSNKVILLFLVIATYGMFFCFPLFYSPLLFRFRVINIIPALLQEFSFITLFVLPLTFFYIITQDKRKSLKYQLLSLPTQRSWIVLSHFMIIIVIFPHTSAYFSYKNMPAPRKNIPNNPI